MPYQIIFFGSFGNCSVSILDSLLKAKSFKLQAVITTPPAPKGRHLHITPNEVQVYSEKHNIPCYPLEKLEPVLQLETDFIIVSGYGKLIPKPWLDLPKIMAVNMHPSLLPQYPGRCPAEWAILNGETETGVTLIQMTEKFDAGPILVQEKIAIQPDDTRLTLYTKLFDLGAKMLIDTLPQLASGSIHPSSKSIVNRPSSIIYAKQITRQDGFLPWNEFFQVISNIQNSIPNKLNIEHWTLDIERKLKAFAGWPGVWTINPDGKRIKLISLEPQILIQEESKSPTPWLH